MLPNSSALAGVGAAARWSILVAFDDSDARRRAMRVCDDMVARFWPEMEFQVHWCSFDQLANEAAATEATRRAATASMVIVASNAANHLPELVHAWTEEWSARRQGREGALIALVDGPPESSVYQATHHHLRNVAHRAGMDYLTDEPSTAPATLPDGPNGITARANELGSMLDGMLQSVTPTGMT
jgi:hypothetical protein